MKFGDGFRAPHSLGRIEHRLRKCFRIVCVV